MWYSPLTTMARGHKATDTAEDEKSYKNVAAFWTVMFCAGDTTEMVNMTPLMEDYKCNNAVPIHFGPLSFAQKLQFRLPLMTNTIDLNVGDLLVMRRECMPEIVCERFPR